MESMTGSEAAGTTGGQQSASATHNSPELPSPPSGKTRKTAFRFFGGRKSICALPSFFSGRGRSQSKRSKTGVTKSQTYDGVSRACWEDVGRSSSHVTSGDFEFCGSCDPQKTPEDHGKSQSLPRQRRGLRGLFSSIRRHRRSKNVDLEKREMFEMSSNLRAKTASGAQLSIRDRSGNHSNSQGEDLGITDSECERTGDVSLVPEKHRSRGEKDKRKKEEDEEKENKERWEELTTYTEELDRLAEQNLDADEEPQVVSCTSDNVSLTFCDVSSLKSFDSLTGCGDIIADQDDVSAVESSVSAERGAGKRSSCFVTYQGGGEEMAAADEEDEEFLQSVWESETSNEVCFLPSDMGSDSLSLTPDQIISSIFANSSSSTQEATETALTPVDLLSPQSEKQESVPNSDEGYCDSTTPGLEEENKERQHQERLPRDSYSGDALYELYEPDDRLLSPVLSPEDGHPFISAALQGDKSSTNPLYGLAFTALETEEERLTRIQRALLSCGLQDLRSPSKHQLLSCKNCFSEETSHAVGNGETSEVVTGINQRYPQSPPITEALKEMPFSRGQIQESLLFKSSCGVSEHQSHLLPTRGCSQSQEDLMVCFSQALVNFTKNKRLYCNSTESLGGSEASSPFGPSLSALPTIVTFDVVDMENEVDCEQQTEMGEEEEEGLTSPHEPFEDEGCYLQQEAFAECDQRIFDSYQQSLLLSNAWGIASLPNRAVGVMLGGPHLHLDQSNNRSVEQREVSVKSRKLEFEWSFTAAAKP